MAKKVKTNALRMLDRAKINYEIKEYQYDEDRRLKIFSKHWF